MNPLRLFEYIVAVGGGLAAVVLMFGGVVWVLYRLPPNPKKASAPVGKLH